MSMNGICNDIRHLQICQAALALFGKAFFCEPILDKEAQRSQTTETLQFIRIFVFKKKSKEQLLWEAHSNFVAMFA